MEKELLKLFEMPTIKVKVNPYWLLKHNLKDNFFNAHIMVRMLAIDCYYNKNDMGWTWYNEMQEKRVADNKLIPKHMAYHKEEFKELIKSIEENGYNDECPIILNKDLFIVDGAHRLATALYFNLKEVTIEINQKSYSAESRDYSFEWFKNHNMAFVEEPAMKKYYEICESYGDNNE